MVSWVCEKEKHVQNAPDDRRDDDDLTRMSSTPNHGVVVEFFTLLTIKKRRESLFFEPQEGPNWGLISLYRYISGKVLHIIKAYIYINS